MKPGLSAPKFRGNLMVEQAKALAEKDPHPFWAIRMRQSQLNREARYGR